MSRIGLKPIAVPAGVSVAVADGTVTIKGPKGSQQLKLPGGIGVAVEGAEVFVTRDGDSRLAKSLHGLTRTQLVNMIKGVQELYKKELEIEGVGFKAALQGKRLEMALGFSHPIHFQIPEGITIVVDGSTKVAVSGMDKQLVGDVAARLRGYFPAEPYKGKGLRYKGEQVRRKEGKTVA